MPLARCKICDSNSSSIFSKNIINKYPTDYFQCQNCGFIQINEPHWLDEVYSEEICGLDIGLIGRNLHYSEKIENLLYNNDFDINAKFLDFAGGYGMFTRMMRDKGFDYYHDDKYSKNIFAKGFELSDLEEEDQWFEIISAIELMEHLVDPYKELDYIFSLTDSFVFTTELVPEDDIENWWYLSPEHGQHVAFHTQKSLDVIAKKYDKVAYSDRQLHIITNKKNSDILNNIHLKFEDTLVAGLSNEMKVKKKLDSRLMVDFEYIKSQLHTNKQ